MVYRIYTEKKEGLGAAAERLKTELKEYLGIGRLEGIRIINRYDAEGVDGQLFDDCRWKLFADRGTENAADELDQLPFGTADAEDAAGYAAVFAVERKPGYEDRTERSKAVCLQMMAGGEKPVVKHAVVYALYGRLMPADVDAVRHYVIDAARERECGLERPETLRGGEAEAEKDASDEISGPEDKRHEVMDAVIESVTLEDFTLERAYKDYLALRKDLKRDMPVTLSDIAGIALRHLKRSGRLEMVEKTGLGSAASVMINVNVNGEDEPWLLSFTSNSDRGLGETDPEGGAEKALGGCIRDALTGRAYTYAAMRITAAASPVMSAAETLPGKTPQRKLSSRSRKAFSDYAEGAGIPVCMADEICHPGYAGCRMETAAVVAAAPRVQVRSEEPAEDDIVMLLGGSRDDAGKLQRFFRNSTAMRMIKKCRPVRDGMEAVIWEENERLFSLMASDEKLRCVRADAAVSENGGGETSGEARHVDIEPAACGDWNRTSLYGEARSFTAAMRFIAQDLNTCSRRGLAENFDSTADAGTVMMPFGGRNQITPMQAMVNLIPLRNGKTDDCSMMAWGYNPLIAGESPYHGAYLAVVESVSKLIATGASPDNVYLALNETFADPGEDPVKWGRAFAAVLGVFEAQLRLGIGAIERSETVISAEDGGETKDTLLSFAVTMAKAGDAVSPEFKKAGHRVVLLKPDTEAGRTGAGAGLPETGSLLKVWETAYELIHSGAAVSAYAVGAGGIGEAVMKMSYGNGIGFRFNIDTADIANTPRIAEVRKKQALSEIFGYSYGSLILEIEDDADLSDCPVRVGILGHTTEEKTIVFCDEAAEIGELLGLYEGRLESVYPAAAVTKAGPVRNIEYKARSWHTPVFKRAEPRVLIPVFEGMISEHDCERAFRDAGAQAELMVIKDGTPGEIRRAGSRFSMALHESHILMIPGGDADRIAAFLRQDAVAESITALIEKQDGLILGVGGGFKALVDLGLLPYGRFTERDENSPSLTVNAIGARRSKIIRVRIASNKSPWLRRSEVGEIHSMPAAYSEGRLYATEEMISHLAGMGQIATQYVDLEGNAAVDSRFNPAGSMMAAEAITSADGRIFGRMGRAERNRGGLYRNVEGRYMTGLFENAVQYFK